MSSHNKGAEEGVLPRRREHHAVIARLVVSRWVPSKDAKERILNVIQSSTGFQDAKKNAVWRFGDVSEVKTEDKTHRLVTFGRLGFERREKRGVEYHEGLRSYKHVKRNKGETDYSNFIIIPDEFLIIFEERPNIKKEQFSGSFNQIYRGVYDDLSNVEIIPLVEEATIKENIKTYAQITRVKMTISRSNPDDEVDFRPLDRLLAASSSEKTNLEFNNEQTGLKIEDTIIGQGIALSDHGYGQYTIKGLKDGVIRTIRSIDRTERITVEIRDEDNVIDIARNMFRAALNKLRKR